MKENFYYIWENMFLKKNGFFSRSTKSQSFVIDPRMELTAPFNYFATR